MYLLSIDTSLSACSVSLTRADTLLAVAQEVMQRGQQERLAPMVSEVLQAAGIAASDVTGIACTVGPGSFTGLRIGIAFAKGLACALGIQPVGLGTLQVLAASSGENGLVASVMDARNGNVFFQQFEGMLPVSAPLLIRQDEAIAAMVDGSGLGLPVLCGPGAALLGSALPAARVLCLETVSPRAMSALVGAGLGGVLRPMYLHNSYAGIA